METFRQLKKKLCCPLKWIPDTFYLRIADLRILGVVVAKRIKNKVDVQLGSFTIIFLFFKLHTNVENQNIQLFFFYFDKKYFGFQKKYLQKLYSYSTSDNTAKIVII